MKDYKIILISFVLLIFMMGAISAADIDSDDGCFASVDESPIGGLPGMQDSVPVDPTSGGDDTLDVEVDTKEIYVQDTGNDSNSGSSESPYATIDKAFSDVNASNDATIYIGEGTFLLNQSLNIDLDHKNAGGNLKFIGAGADKTFIDGLNTYFFATIGSNANVTLKDITFTNCKNSMGGTIVCNGYLNVDSCVFNNSYATGNNGGVIYANGGFNVEPNITIKNSKFISSYVNSRNNIMNKYGGAAIYAKGSYLYLENNTFFDTRLSTRGGVGAAIYTTSSKNYLIKNKFINLTGTSDASIYIDGGSVKEIIGNEFINCTNPTSQVYSIVYLGSGDYLFENNTFVNSSNSVGNIYAQGSRISSLSFSISQPMFNVGNYEFNNNLYIPLSITDDMGNIVKLLASFEFRLTGEKSSYSFIEPQNTQNYYIAFDNALENGIYNLTIKYNEDINTGEYSITDVLTTLNISISTDPVDLYVSPEGSDANEGSIDSPFGTIQHAIDVGFERSFNVVIHLLEGTYSGEGNVGLLIANKGTIQILGEKYGETIIDANEETSFFEISTEAIIKNLKFINGMGPAIYGNDKVTLIDCIVDSNNGDGAAIVVNVNMDNLTFTNNYGYVSLGSTNNFIVNNSYFANNYNEEGSGILYSSVWNYPLTIENCKFINNTASEYGGAIYIEDASAGVFIKNCYFEGNSAQDGGAIYVPYEIATVIFENDTFRNNKAVNNGVIGFYTDAWDVYMSPALIFNDCRFINNSATKAGVATLKIGIFNNCLFANNSADYGGALVVLPYCIELEDMVFIAPEYEEAIISLELNDVIFENNVAEINGNDIYLDEKTSHYLGDDYQYFPLTITFNDLNVNSFEDTLTATVDNPYNAVIGSAYGIIFKLNDSEIGSANIVNGVATFNYAGFEDGEYVLSGNFYMPHSEDVINEANVVVKLENVIDHVEFWISPEGSDENGNGSEFNPFKSLSHAITEAGKLSRDIVINMAEGTYAGDLNTALTLSAMRNVTIIGAGVNKTVIDGENVNYFLTVTNGKNKIVISDLTIKNMLPDNRQSKTIDSNVPITIEEGAILALNNVVLSDNHGGEAIILNNGDLIINNSVITRNGLSSNAIIYGGNVYIDNSEIFDNYAIGGRSHIFYGIIGGGNLIVLNNTILKGNYILITPSQLNGNDFLLMSASDIVIENTNVSSGGNNESLKTLGFDESVTFHPALSISGKTNMTNSIMNNDFEGTIYSIENTQSSSYAVVCPSAFNTYSVMTGAEFLNIFNSSFTNFRYMWLANAYTDFKYTFDGCLFENITYVALSRTIGPGSQYNITNSIFLFDDDVIMNQIRFADCDIPNVMANNNYWGNSQPIMYFLGNTGIKEDTYAPDTWIILTVEDGVPVFKVTDGENVSDYEGILPAKISYVADENGDVVPVVNIAGTGYKFGVDENGNVILNTTEPMENIVPKIPADETVFASDVVVIVNDGSKFTANFTDKWGDALKNTLVSFATENGVINVTTDANGVASFDIDFNAGIYTVTITNPVTGQSISKTITVTVVDTISVDNVTAVYNDGSKFNTTFTDEFGSPLANTNVTFKIGNDTIAAITDANGVASFDIDFNAGSYNVTIINPVTGQSINRTITVNKLATALTAANVNMFYNTGKYLKVTLKDINKNVLAKQKVIIKINGKSYNRVTNSKGQVSFKITLSVKTYTATITYQGTDNYIKSTVKPKVVVKKATPRFVAKAKAFKLNDKTKKYVIILKDNKNKVMKNTMIYIKVNGKTYSAKTNAKGQATFKLNKLSKVGSFYAALKFKGNKNFKPISKTVKISVKK